jgi:hypothetical protein
MYLTIFNYHLFIEIKSVPNEGTTFTISIPTEGVNFEKNVSMLEANLNKLNLLVLIQDEFNKEIFRKFLLRLNCPLSFATDYDDFFQKFNKLHQYNVYIIDYDQFSLGEDTVFKNLVKQKRQVELRTNKTMTLVILSTNLELDSRSKLKYTRDRVLILRKPVKSETLRICLSEISKKEKTLMPFLILRDNKFQSMRLGKNQDVMSKKNLSSFTKMATRKNLLNLKVETAEEIKKIQLKPEPSLNTPAFKDMASNEKILDVKKLNERLK